MVAEYYCRHISDVANTIQKIKTYYDEIKKIELFFFKDHDINIVLEEDAIDHIIAQVIREDVRLGDVYENLSKDFHYGLKLIQEKTGKNRFFLPRKALTHSEEYLNQLIKNEIGKIKSLTE